MISKRNQTCRVYNTRCTVLIWLQILSNFNRIFIVVIKHHGRRETETAMTYDRLKISHRWKTEEKKSKFIRAQSAATDDTEGAAEAEVIVCFSARPGSSEISLRNPFARERNAAAMSPAMCFEWIYMTSHRVPTSLFAARTRASRVRMRACVSARGLASMWAEIPCSGRCWTIFPWPPSRYETRYDYTLSAHRRQGRTVLPDSSTRSSDPRRYYATFPKRNATSHILIFDIARRIAWHHLRTI